MQMSLCTTRNPPIKITLTPEGGNIYKKKEKRAKEEDAEHRCNENNNR